MHYSLFRNTIVNFAELDILIKVIIIDWTISLYLSVYSVNCLVTPLIIIAQVYSYKMSTLQSSRFQ
jgi:hypothetical protein